MANDPRDSRRKDKHITGRRILIDIYKGENKVRGKIYKGQQKVSTRFGNGVIVRQGMESKYHYHIKEPWTFCNARA